MDNLCHTLVGAALGQAGLKHRTALGMATLVIGANLPDLDAIAVPLGHSLEWRRGWTHGVPALLVLPVLLTLAMLAWDRWFRREDGTRPITAVRPGPTLLLAYIGVWSHPVLDWMNTYGMRWLMPLRDVWYYGDTLFIIDPWLWLVLGLGVWLSRRRERRRHRRPARPARVALLLSGGYVAAMLALAFAGRALVRGQMAAMGVDPAAPLLVSPRPADPFHRDVVFQSGDAYRLGTLAWLPRPALELEPEAVPRNHDHPAARAAAARPELRPFLHWARFPFYVVERGVGGTRVHVLDARYTREPDARIGSVTVELAPGEGE